MTIHDWVSDTLGAVAFIFGLRALLYARQTNHLARVDFKKKARRAPRKHLPSNDRKRLDWKRKQPNRCEYCGTETVDVGNDWNRKTVDHVIPTVRGGEDKKSNWKVACHGCNKDKGNLTLREWQLVRDFRKKSGNPFLFPYEREKLKWTERQGFFNSPLFDLPRWRDK